jgi:hypothetical protein
VRVSVLLLCVVIARHVYRQHRSTDEDGESAQSTLSARGRGARKGARGRNADSNVDGLHVANRMFIKRAAPAHARGGKRAPGNAGGAQRGRGAGGKHKKQQADAKYEAALHKTAVTAAESALATDDDDNMRTGHTAQRYVRVVSLNSERHIVITVRQLMLLHAPRRR